MSFPNVERIVYSTCSIHEEENENVVRYALENCNKNFQLVNILEDKWTNGRGITKTDYDKNVLHLDYCIRTSYENNFTNGLKSFLDSNKESKNSGKSWLLQNLIGCATLQRCSTFQLPGQDEWIIDLQLMSVRAKYRGLNIGKYLLNLIQNRDYVGNFDAIVTSSDLDAIKFYEKYGFNVDPILNSKYLKFFTMKH